MKVVFMSKPGPCAGIAPIAIVAVLLLLLASAPLDVHSKPRPAPSPLPWVPIHAIFGTPYLYAPHEFTVDPNVVPKNSAKYQVSVSVSKLSSPTNNQEVGR